jgi:predicted nucleic acid-binding protein
VVNSPYWDTSCILALYVAETLSQPIAARASKEKQALTSSAILEYEMIFALHAKEARGEIPPDYAARALAKFQSDLQKGRFLLAPLGQDIKIRAAEAARAALRNDPPMILRTLDGIHIATVLQLHSAELITADKRMADAARTFGIRVQEFRSISKPCP